MLSAYPRRFPALLQQKDIPVALCVRLDEAESYMILGIGQAHIGFRVLEGLLQSCPFHGEDKTD